jgi:threonyl-tRNA synthetase
MRVQIDTRREKINLKIRDAQMQKIPYMIIVGDKEIGADRISVRSREEGDIGSFSLLDFMKKLREQIDKKI